MALDDAADDVPTTARSENALQGGKFAIRPVPLGSGGVLSFAITLPSESEASDAEEDDFDGNAKVAEIAWDGSLRSPGMPTGVMCSACEQVHEPDGYCLPPDGYTAQWSKRKERWFLQSIKEPSKTQWGAKGASYQPEAQPEPEPEPEPEAEPQQVDAEAELSEQAGAATKIAAVQRGKQDRARVAQLRAERAAAAADLAAAEAELQAAQQEEAEERKPRPMTPEQKFGMPPEPEAQAAREEVLHAAAAPERKLLSRPLTLSPDQMQQAADDTQFAARNSGDDPDELDELVELYGQSLDAQAMERELREGLERETDELRKEKAAVEEELRKTQTERDQLRAQTPGAADEEESVKAAGGGEEAHEAEVKKLKALFHIVDIDGSGELDREEVAQLSKDMGAVLSEEELDGAMSEMDGDGSGEVDFDEFREWFFGAGKSKWKQMLEEYAPWQLALAPPEKTADEIKKENELAVKQAKDQDLENIRRISLVYIRAQIMQVYETYNPEKLEDVDPLLEEWKGEEDILLWNVQHKYADAKPVKRKKKSSGWFC